MSNPGDHGGWVNLVVAMPSEARPLIDHHRLTTVRDAEPFRCFVGDGLRLVISGIGREAAAAAAGFLFQLSGAERDQGWLNLGVGGHGRLPLGSIRLGHKILDAASGRAWYPPRVHEVPCPPAEIRSVVEVERRYETAAIYEMEASGFLATCTRFTIAEQVQVVKIISDNRSSPPERVTREQIEQWIVAQLAVIDTVIGSLRAVATDLAQRRAAPPDLEYCRERWHFTVTQTHELRDLLRRWQLLLPQEQVGTCLASQNGATGVLAELRQTLTATPPRLELP